MKTIESSCTFEGELVNYYDKFFLENRSIPVEDEVRYLLDLWDMSDAENKSLLDIGCGTGYHDSIFAGYFKSVVGADISQDMVDYAADKHKLPNLEFKRLDICDSGDEAEFDVVTALSHVIGYQLDNQSVETMIGNMGRKIHLGGGIEL